MTGYAATHQRTLQLIRRKGAPVVFTSVQTTSYNPVTNVSTEQTLTVGGHAIAVSGDPLRYEALHLVQSDAITLLFAPTTFGQLPPLGSSVPFGGSTWIVRDVEPTAPDGTAIAARIIAAGGGRLPGAG